MKNIIKNLSKFAFALSMFFLGTGLALAASFDVNPSNRPVGITSINDCEQGDKCGGIKDSVSVNIPNPGDTAEVTVFTDYMPDRSRVDIIYGAQGKYTTLSRANLSSPSFTFKSCLFASNANQICDTARVDNLPSSYSIEFDGAHLENRHGGKNGCRDIYNYHIELGAGDSLFTTGHDLGDLSNERGTFCPQGTISVGYKITNTEKKDPSYTYSWDIGTWSSWSSCENGEQERTRTVRCRRSDGKNVSSSYCDGQKPRSRETQTCSSNNINFDIQTKRASSVEAKEAQLNGELVNGNNTDVWFVLSNTNTNPQCDSSLSQRGFTTKSGEASFSYRATNLSPQRHYYYRACGQEGETIKSGYIYDFYTKKEKSNDNGVEPVAETREEEDVDESSAVLRGKVKMNSFKNGIVFFVFGQDKSDIEDVDTENDRYSEIKTRGEKIRKVKVDTDNDESSWEKYEERVTGLDKDERYYYRICVQYDKKNGNETLTCGGTERFSTDADESKNTTYVKIRTLNPESVSTNFAKICGDLVDNGGDSNLRTWLEYRRSGRSSWEVTRKKDRGEIRYCETIRNLKSGTRYDYRACSDEGCDSSRRFVTSRGYVTPSQKEPQVTTENAYAIGSHSAVLPGIFVSHADRAQVWFQYGRSQNLNRQTRIYTKYGEYGEFVHNFTNLKANQLYCYRAVVKTDAGTDAGATKCFTTKPVYSGSTTKKKVVKKPKVVVVEKDDDPEIDLEKLGLGLSLVRLEIDDERVEVGNGDRVTYEVRWENISQLDLEDVDLSITIPRKMQIIASSRGQLDQDRNAIFYTIDNLDAQEKGSMTVSALVKKANLGDALTADATLAFKNPVNRAQENATDYDVDEYVLKTAVGTASVFGLSQIGFLGWLTILLGLIIVFLVARWLYLEREELRAQAYVNGYGRPYMAPAPAPMPMREAYYVEPTPAPVAPAPQAPQAAAVQEKAEATNGERPEYRPYRPKH